MTRIFLCGMVWVAYPLMALVFGAMVLGRQSESPLIAYDWMDHGEKGYSELYVADVSHNLSLWVADGVSYIDPFEWVENDSLLYYRSDLTQFRGGVTPPAEYEIYHLYEEYRPLDLPDTDGIWGIEFSPDMHYVAYIQEYILYIRNLETGEVKQITHEEYVPLFAMEWSPDNCRLAYIQSAGLTSEIPATLYISDVCTETQAIVLESFHIYLTIGMGLSWSYEGGYIAFAEITDIQTTYIRVVDVETNALAFPEFSVSGPSSISWSPNANQFVFSARVDPTQLANIYLADVGTGLVTQLTDSLDNDFSPQWSPDGRQIIFTSTLQSMPLYNERRLMIMNADGSNRRRVLHNDGFFVSAQWQPLR